MRVETIGPNGEATLYLGDCLDVLPELDAESVDAIVTDPPYGLSFMGKAWDSSVPSVAVWKAAMRVLKPGGHLLAFAGTRTQHRMASAIEDAGFEIRDMIAWVYGKGFPKSLDVSKAIDKAAGAEREVVGVKTNRQPTGNAYAQDAWTNAHSQAHEINITAPATPEAQQWNGWGTALKPALEPITVARKPLAKGNTVAANVLEYGTGAINVNGCRVGTDEKMSYSSSKKEGVTAFGTGTTEQNPAGRFPANLIHDGSDEVVRLFPVTHGAGHKRSGGLSKNGDSMFCGNHDGNGERYGDSGSTARFFYCAKASKRDRDEGCEGLQEGPPPASARSKPAEGRQSALGKPRRNHHPTVKPTDLMRYLVRLVTPPGGVVLDPFMGSGSTGKAAILEDMRFIGVDTDPESIEIARARIKHACRQPSLFEDDGGGSLT